MDSADLLNRLAAALKADIGPAIDDEYPRTQAFMMAVILERLSREVALGPSNAAIEADDVAALSAALGPMVAGGPPELVEAVATCGGTTTVDALTPVVEALYRWEAEAAAEALALVRPVLRRDIDRRMRIAQ